MKVEPATLRDATYVLWHMRPADEVEVMCQMPEGADRTEIAYGLLMSDGASFAIRRNGTPVAFFGTAPMNAGTLSIWALGTKAIPRVVPVINRFMTQEHLPRRIAEGYHAMEARSHADHVEAHRWLRSVGAEAHGPAFEFGRDREKFLLFRWTKDVFESIQAKRRRAV